MGYIGGSANNQASQATQNVDSRQKVTFYKTYVSTAELLLNDCESQPEESIYGIIASIITLNIQALEAYANHKLKELVDQNKIPKDKYENYISKMLLDKFNHLYDFFEKTFYQGKEPIQSVSALIQLRNRLVHFLPEWSDEDGKNNKVLRNLQGKFNFNDKELFPRNVLVKECAYWSNNSVKEFLTVCDSDLTMKRTEDNRNGKVV
ncbi:hypothetical protein [Zooshikella ganghwensis]|uniref:hypothetical protein n=1 Tax=Zooshikella ganghwensis TaxID=202772 RepID=UPI0004184A6A|nr:hypothetical protein [Zooshikella ganghwensis]